MFFMGILMSVEALNAAGLLGELARALSDAVPNVDIIAASIGLVSALIDNVPLVSASFLMMTWPYLWCCCMTNQSIRF
jgi:Na+/H+ antiporter NhaD/arsenite permease-like protein